MPIRTSEKIKKWNVEKNRSRLRMAPFLFVQKAFGERKKMVSFPFLGINYN